MASRQKSLTRNPSVDSIGRIDPASQAGPGLSSLHLGSHDTPSPRQGIFREEKGGTERWTWILSSSGADNTSPEGRFSMASMEKSASRSLFSSYSSVSHCPSSIARAPSNSDASQSLCRHSSIGYGESSQPHVLVVDDGHVNRLVLTRMLEGLDVSCATAEDGEQAVRECGSEAMVFSAILMDLHMVTRGMKNCLDAAIERYLRSCRRRRRSF